MWTALQLFGLALILLAGVLTSPVAAMAAFGVVLFLVAEAGEG